MSQPLALTLDNLTMIPSPDSTDNLSLHEENMTIESLKLPKRVWAVMWAPQNDLLASPAVKAFVTHGGSNSVYEAAYHAMPIVAMPIFGDQPSNAAKVLALHLLGSCA